MSGVDFSIVVPVYNIERFLSDSVESLLRQTYQRQWYEVILVNDGSTDGSGGVCNAYAEKYDHISVVHRKNGGLSAARNSGIRAARNEYVVFLDGDDWLVRDALLRFSRIIAENNRPDVVIGGYQQFLDKNAICVSGRYSRDVPKALLAHPIRGREFFIKLLENASYLPPACLKICRRTFLIDNELYFYENRVHEDEEWSPRLYWMAESVVAMDFYFYCYRYRANSITTTKKDTKRIADMALNIGSLVKYFSSQLLTDREKTVLASFLSYRWRRLLSQSVGEGNYSKSEILCAYGSLFNDETRRECRRWLNVLPLPKRLLPFLAINADYPLAFWAIYWLKKNSKFAIPKYISHAG